MPSASSIGLRDIGVACGWKEENGTFGRTAHCLLSSEIKKWGWTTEERRNRPLAAGQDGFAWRISSATVAEREADPCWRGWRFFKRVLKKKKHLLCYGSRRHNCQFCDHFFSVFFLNESSFVFCVPQLLTKNDFGQTARNWSMALWCRKICSIF